MGGEEFLGGERGEAVQGCRGSRGDWGKGEIGEICKVRSQIEPGYWTESNHDQSGTHGVPL